MVRLDKCVEALYDGDTMEDKHKSLHILKVMKGAISVSKSKTGDCIFRSNKTERKNLERMIKSHQRNSVYNVARIDTNKKLVVDRWTKILEHQTTCSSQTLFEDLLDIGGDTSNNLNSSTNTKQVTDEGDNKLKRLIDIRLGRYEPSNLIVIPERKRAHSFVSVDTEHDAKVNSGEEMFVTEKKEIRDKLIISDEPSAAKSTLPNKNNMKIQGSVLAKSTPLRLPSLAAHAGFKPTYSVKENKPDSEVPRPTLERDLTNWNDWRLKDKDWILGYIHREKTRHEDLIIRNALGNIEREMSGANMIKRHQIRQKLQNEKDAEMRKKQQTSSPTRENPRMLAERPSMKSRNQPKKQVKYRRQEQVNAQNENVQDLILPERKNNKRKHGATEVPGKLFSGTLPVIFETLTGAQGKMPPTITVTT